MIGSAEQEAAGADVPKNYAQLELMMGMHAFMAWIFIVVLLDVSKPIELTGLILLVHAVMVSIVLFVFHVCDKSIAIAKSAGTLQSSTHKASHGFAGGIKSSFFLYLLAATMYTHRIVFLYTTCAFKSFTVHFKAEEWIELTFAAVFIVLALISAELARRDSLPLSVYD